MHSSLGRMGLLADMASWRTKCKTCSGSNVTPPFLLAVLSLALLDSVGEYFWHLLQWVKTIIVNDPLSYSSKFTTDATTTREPHIYAHWYVTIFITCLRDRSSSWGFASIAAASSSLGWRNSSQRDISYCSP